ncbi:MAG: cadmium-translocating P-type ATPase [Armatimonadetes bacterium]|nr:cadmium-translocating P-type ATPase [Armatimonadota bacterium]
MERAAKNCAANCTCDTPKSDHPQRGFTRQVLTLFALVFGAILFVAVVGEWLGLFKAVSARVPWFLGLVIVLAGGYPIFLNVLRAAVRGKITSHTLMTLGVIAALAIGEWTTAAIVVFFMRMGEYAESFTLERARSAVKNLTAMTPLLARIIVDGDEREAPVSEALLGLTVVARPGEKIPVDGEVLAGHGTVDQSTITGESMPIEMGPGAKVFAATLLCAGSLRIRVTHTGPDTTFGRIIKMVEEAEAHRADVQRIADRFSAYYLPVVTGVAALTFLIRHDPLATAAVLVVACSCSFALATPIAMIASIGAGAKKGLLIKGGKYLESLARADTILIDKTGTLTLGRPELTDVVPLNGYGEQEILSLAASAERYSEHPLADAIRKEAHRRNLPAYEPDRFQATPGMGIEARVNGMTVAVGNRRLLDRPAVEVAEELEAAGKTLLFVLLNGAPAGILGCADTLRPEVPEAVAALRKMGIEQMELLTGDNEQTAAPLGQALEIPCRSNLLPEEKISIVKEYQSKGHTVVMVGDGVNDAPALAQADVGVAMGAAGTDIAVEAARIALMREDWTLVPEVLRIARRTMGVVKLNIAFTVVYNAVGLTLAALGFLPPVLAAAAQSLPDLGILANSSRLLRSR